MKQLLKHSMCIMALWSISFGAMGGDGTVAEVVSGYFGVISPLKFSVSKGIEIETANFGGGLKNYLKEQLSGEDLLNVEKYKAAGLVFGKDFSVDDLLPLSMALLKGRTLSDAMKSSTLKGTLIGCSSCVKLGSIAIRRPPLDVLRLGYAYILYNMPQTALNTFVALVNSLFQQVVRGFKTPALHHTSINLSQMLLIAISGIIQVDSKSLSANLVLLMLKDVIRIGSAATGQSPAAFIHLIQHKL